MYLYGEFFAIVNIGIDLVINEINRLTYRLLDKNQNPVYFEQN